MYYVIATGSEKQEARIHAELPSEAEANEEAKRLAIEWSNRNFVVAKVIACAVISAVLRAPHLTTSQG